MHGRKSSMGYMGAHRPDELMNAFPSDIDGKRTKTIKIEDKVEQEPYQFYKFERFGS